MFSDSNPMTEVSTSQTTVFLSTSLLYEYCFYGTPFKHRVPGKPSPHPGGSKGQMSSQNRLGQSLSPSRPADSEGRAGGGSSWFTGQGSLGWEGMNDGVNDVQLPPGLFQSLYTRSRMWCHPKAGGWLWKEQASYHMDRSFLPP